MVDQLLSQRLEGIGEYYFSKKLRDIEALKTQGHKVLNLGIGSPDIKPPAAVESALIEALKESNSHQYQSYKGIPELRSAFADWYQTYFKVELSPETEILPLIGSKEGIMHICMSLLNPGDQVLVPNPGYPTYEAASKLAGGEVIHYSLTEKNNYSPDFKELESTDLSKVKIMWVNYPHMPTGADGNESLFNQLKEFSRKHGIVIVNDNPYGFILTDKHESLLKNRLSTDLVLELNSLSKSHNMAGWRVGVLSGNEELIQAVLTFKSNMDSGKFKPVMKAAIAALNVPSDWYDQQNKTYLERRKLVFKVVEQLECQANPDQVGMFVWAKIPDHQSQSEAFADHLLTTYRIFVPPGTVFGTEGHQHIRFSLCSDIPVWKEVINRINNLK
ncbi:MAG: aminotransferase class I/II-fold pyridoxal phosphate-dependent enzyme [Bacteroidota bacterium]